MKRRCPANISLSSIYSRTDLRYHCNITSLTPHCKTTKLHDDEHGYDIDTVFNHSKRWLSVGTLSFIATWLIDQWSRAKRAWEDNGRHVYSMHYCTATDSQQLNDKCLICIGALRYTDSANVCLVYYLLKEYDKTHIPSGLQFLHKLHFPPWCHKPSS